MKAHVMYNYSQNRDRSMSRCWFTRSVHRYLAMFAIVVISLSARPVSAGVMGYNFSQDGFAEGAVVSGMFFGEDIDMNGQLSSFRGEVTDFMMSFSGNSMVQAFDAVFVDLFGLVYDLNDGPVIGDGLTIDIEGIGVDSLLGFSYTTGNGPGPFPGGLVSNLNTGAQSRTPNNAVVSPKAVVPEPISFATWSIFGLLGATYSRRRHRHRA